MQQIQAGKIAAKWYKNEKNGPPLGVPQWGAPMGLIFTCIPHFTSKEITLQPVFACFPHDAAPQRRDAYPQSSGHRVVLGEVVSTCHTHLCVPYTFVDVLIPNSP